MAQSARRSVVGVQRNTGQTNAQGQANIHNPNEEMKVLETEREDTHNEISDPNNTVLQKRIAQMNYLESENQNLQMENEDLSTTLKINKDIIQSLLTGDRKFDAQFEYAFAQITQENELWETRVKTLTQQRDRLLAEQLMQQQIISHTQDKEEDIAEIYKDEIDELKESLERKEYLLQLAEQRVAAYEKLLMNLGARDAEVQAKLNEQKIVLKERKITNVVMENAELKQSNTNLLEQNNLMREQLESVLFKLQEGQIQDPQLMVEEISIFQNKMTENFPKKMLEQVRNKVGGATNSNDHNFGESGVQGNSGGNSIAPGDNWQGPTGSTTTLQDAASFDQREYVKKLEHSIQWLEEKLQRARTDFKTLKKENANLKDSNENHLFINEKLNKALKKSEERIEKLTQKIKTITNESVILPKRQVVPASEKAQTRPKVVVENGPSNERVTGRNDVEAGFEDGDDFFGGDVSSICIKPDQIMHDQNIANE